MADPALSCPACGTPSTSGGSRFCRNCGAVLQPSAGAPARSGRPGLLLLIAAMVLVIGGGTFAALELRNDEPTTPLAGGEQKKGVATTAAELAPYIGKTYECRRQRDIDEDHWWIIWRVHIEDGTFTIDSGTVTEPFDRFIDGTWSYDASKRQVDARMVYPGGGVFESVGGVRELRLQIKISGGQITVEQVPMVAGGLSESYNISNAIDIVLIAVSSATRNIEDLSMRCEEAESTSIRDTPAAQDYAAKSSVRNAITAAKAFATDTDSYASLTPAAIQEQERSLTVIRGDQASERPTQVSMSVQGEHGWIVVFSARTASGKCFAMRDSLGDGYVQPNTSYALASGRCAANEIPSYEFAEPPWVL